MIVIWAMRTRVLNSLSSTKINCINKKESRIYDADTQTANKLLKKHKQN